MFNYPELPRFTIDALGIQTSYYCSGREHHPPLLLLHGMSTSGDNFRELMHELTDDYWLIAPDIPGFGYSDDTSPYTVSHLIEWLAAFCDGLNLSAPHLLGHSFGGVLASAYALAYPAGLSSLILLAPATLQVGYYPEWLRSFSKSPLSETVLKAGIAASRLLLKRKIRLPFYDPERFADSLWDRRTADYSRSRASAAVLRTLALFDLRPHLPTIQHPTYILWGENDPILNPADAYKLAHLMPAAHLQTLPACGHTPQVEQRQQVVAAIRQFTQKIV